MATVSCNVDFSKRALVLVTGASKGIGRTIAVEMARNLNETSVLLLLARSGDGLQETKSLIEEVDKSITVLTNTIDLATATQAQFESILKISLGSISTANLETAIIIHNAGSTGEVKQTTDLTDYAIWRQYYDLNLFSVSILNSLFLKRLKPICPKIFVVNMTSLCGRTPFVNLAMYGSGKAARELFFKVLALEEPQVTVLNYSPGPVDTEMFEGIMANAQSTEVRNSFKKVKDQSILSPEETVGKLVGLLQKGNFKSGDTIDYYDA